MIEVVAGIDEEQLRSLHTLHGMWTLEEHGKALNDQAWFYTMSALCNGGLWVPFIAYDDFMPVGCVELFVQHDLLSDCLVAAGDRAFVLPEWRDTGVFSQMYEAIHAIAVDLGASKLFVPVGVDKQGQFLQAFYTRNGFEISGVTMRKVR